MHTIYIDVLIFTNLFQDFLTLLLLKRILHLKCKFFRLLLGSVFGSITSLVALLPQLNFSVNFFLKLCIALLLILITFGAQDRKIFIKSVATLFILTFLINGAIIMFYLAIKPKGMAIINDVVYFNISPLLLIILTFLVYLILYFYRKLFKNQSKNYEVETISITHNNKEYNVRCKIDSGCIVKEPFSGSYVIIVEESQLENIHIEENKLRIIPFSSLGGDGIINGFRADEVKIGNKNINCEVYIGMCKNIFKNDIKGLIPKCILED